MIDEMTKLSHRAGIHEYTGHMLLFSCMSGTLKRYYQEAGIEEQIWFQTMFDLKYKLIECKNVYDIWGVFVAGWYDKFFNMTRFGIGRLQFDIVPFQRYYEKNGVVLTPETIVLGTHIPRTGTRLDPVSVKESYEEAVVFAREKFGVTRPVFTLYSWLLFPKLKTVLSPKSNIYSFVSDFDMIEDGEFDDYTDVWRLFDCRYTGNVDELPQDSSLRRTYADWIRKGEKIGWGYGVYVWPV